MSKKLIAGAGVVASFAVALAPLATFATVADAENVTRVDTLTATVDTSCTIDTTNATAVTPATDPATYTLDNTYAAGTITPGQSVSDITASSTEKTMQVLCNNVNGFHITAAASDSGHLMHTDASAYIPAGNPVSGTSYWAMKVTGANSGATRLAPANGYGSYKGLTNDDTVAAKPVMAAGEEAQTESFTVLYEVGASTAQKAGAYSGTITYTLVQGQES